MTGKIGKAETDTSGFVVLADIVPAVIQEIRYYSTYNFIGERIPGYAEPCALMTKEAAQALLSVSAELAAKGLRLKIFDAYRPADAVRYFINWCADEQDQRMKPYFYPEIEKQDIFKNGFLADRSSHSRGSTVDLTLLDMSTGRELDMGSPFDLFSDISRTDSKLVTPQQHENRLLLQKAMLRGGFEPLDCEWWHFTLKDEPYPDTYFEFPVSKEYLKEQRR